MGSAALTVRDLEEEVSFYTQTLGLDLLDRTAAEASVGAGGRILLTLTGNVDAPNARYATGLFHLALLYPDRVELAEAARRLVDRGYPLQGASDHLVSEAVYLADPEGNGIESYRDRPRDEWPIEGERIRMQTLPLLLPGLLRDAPGRDIYRAPDGVVLGHVHLRVSRLDDAERFYGQGLGMRVTERMGSRAVFLSWGGYHHHVGINTWQTLGAPPPPRGAMGLHSFTLREPDASRRDGIRSRLEEMGFEVEAGRQALVVEEPAGALLRVVSA